MLRRFTGLLRSLWILRPRRLFLRGFRRFGCLLRGLRRLLCGLRCILCELPSGLLCSLLKIRLGLLDLLLCLCELVHRRGHFRGVGGIVRLCSCGLRHLRRGPGLRLVGAPFQFRLCRRELRNRSILLLRGVGHIRLLHRGAGFLHFFHRTFQPGCGLWDLGELLRECVRLAGEFALLIFQRCELRVLIELFGFKAAADLRVRAQLGCGLIAEPLWQRIVPVVRCEFFREPFVEVRLLALLRRGVVHPALLGDDLRELALRLAQRLGPLFARGDLPRDFPQLVTVRLFIRCRLEKLPGLQRIRCCRCEWFRLFDLLCRGPESFRGACVLWICGEPRDLAADHLHLLRDGRLLAALCLELRVLQRAGIVRLSAVGHPRELDSVPEIERLPVGKLVQLP